MRMLATGMLLVATAAFAAEQPADFAYGLQGKFEGEEAFFQVELPAAVYQGVARSDLGDLRVFNGAGEVVPHALKPRELAGKTPSPPAKLATFPLKGEEAAGIGALELRVRKDSGGMIVNLRSPAARPAGATLLGYLVDASALKQALRALDLDWEPVAEGFAGRMRVALPQQNTVVRALVLSRAGTADAWRPAATVVLYRFRRQGQEVLSPDIVIATDHDRYWLLRVDARGGGLGAGLPTLSTGWVPHQLVFAARGAGPFQIAYGNRDMKPAAYAIDTLIPGYSGDAEIHLKAADAAGAPVIRPLRASVEEPRRLGGDKLLEERINLKKWSLRGSLLLGVLMLGWMALRLMKQMDKTDPRKQGQGEQRGQ